MTVPCPHCTRGTRESCGRFYRCGFCAGTGRLTVPNPITKGKSE